VTFLAGATFDGRYVYFAPSYQGVAVRFDTHSAFDSRASWSQFDTKTRPVGQVCFVGATFDGRYVYYLPLVNCSPSGAGTPLVTRYDTTAAFAAWRRDRGEPARDVTDGLEPAASEPAAPERA